MHWAVLLTVVLLQLWFGLFRIDPIDVPEHLAVGRMIWATGRPMTTNEISWTFPDFPNEQQYPLYQVILYLLQAKVGWWSLSVFCSVGWAAAVALWARWAGSLATAARLAPLWFLAVMGVQRHLVARPEVFTLLGLAAMLVLFERWRERPTVGPLGAMLAVFWVMVNTHQMYVLGFFLLIGFIVHVGLSRALQGRGWVDDTDAELPLVPLGLTLGASLVVMAASPLGVRAWFAPWALVTTVLHLGGDAGVAESDELAPIWADPVGGPVAAVLTGLVLVAAWRSRGRWQVLELGMLAMGFGLVLIAMRGIPFFALAAAAVFSRWWTRSPTWMPEAHLLRTVAVGLAGWLALVLLIMQVTPRPHVYLARQQGMGKSIGEWGDEATTFLREQPPPGEMLNIGWVGANYLNFAVYPVRRVFVDGRWEAYPKPFLEDAMRMQREQPVLDQMIEEWSPGFAVAEMRDPDQLDRVRDLVAQGWGLAYVDSILTVVVRPTPAGSAYLRAHPVDLATLEVLDAVPEHPVLMAQQQIRVAGLLRRLGEAARAQVLLDEASQVDHPAVPATIERYR